MIGPTEPTSTASSTSTSAPPASIASAWASCFWASCDAFWYSCLQLGHSCLTFAWKTGFSSASWRPVFVSGSSSPIVAALLDVVPLPLAPELLVVLSSPPPQATRRTETARARAATASPLVWVPFIWGRPLFLAFNAFTSLQSPSKVPLAHPDPGRDPPRARQRAVARAR